MIEATNARAISDAGYGLCFNRLSPASLLTHQQMRNGPVFVASIRARINFQTNAIEQQRRKWGLE